MERSCTSADAPALTATIGSAWSASWESRLGIERPVEESWQVVVAWSTDPQGDDGGSRPPDAVDTVVVVRSPDGRSYSSQDGKVSDDATVSGPGLEEEPWWPVPDLIFSASAEAPEDVSGWTARAILLDDGGRLVAECSAPVPATPAASRPGGYVSSGSSPP